ncbi:aminodeoxychorismate synthase component I, partial [Micromonospora deserti]
MIDVPAAPAGCRRRLAERVRWEWRPGDTGDPATGVEEFLAAHGLPLHDLARPARAHDPDGPCGAALYVSAAAGAFLTGAPAGAANPAPALPEVAVVVYD